MPSQSCLFIYTAECSALFRAMPVSFLVGERSSNWPISFLMIEALLLGETNPCLICIFSYVVSRWKNWTAASPLGSNQSTMLNISWTFANASIGRPSFSPIPAIISMGSNSSGVSISEKRISALNSFANRSLASHIRSISSRFSIRMLDLINAVLNITLNIISSRS